MFHFTLLYSLFALSFKLFFFLSLLNLFVLICKTNKHEHHVSVKVCLPFLGKHRVHVLHLSFFGLMVY